MSLLTLIITLLLEHFYPLSARKYLSDWLNRYAQFFENRFNASNDNQGRFAWLLAVLPLLAVVMAIFWLLSRVHPIVALAFNVLVLYIAMGFRQYSQYCTDIQRTLSEGDLDKARGLLSRWRGVPSHDFTAEEVARVSIEQAIIATQRNVLGVIIWFALFGMLGLGGAAGALLYRLGNVLRARWGGENESEPGAIGAFARRAYFLLEWVPLRLSAMTFAIVGDLDNTLHCWRTQTASWPDPEAGILLACGAGALGVRLGMQIPQGGSSVDRPELGVGNDADPGFMQSAIGLAWRSVVCWMIVLLMLTLANFLE